VESVTQEVHHCDYATVVGTIRIQESHDCIIAVNLIHQSEGIPLSTAEETPVLREAATQLSEYFGGTRTEFSLPLNPIGTPFQLAVWKALCQIPYGETRSYRDIAEMIGNPKAVRAVGMANHRNPITFIIPCHRVIGSDGSLTGYGGGLPLKQFLLDLEQPHACITQ
jgi:methylated-DNA-[protein]-cysteine S-methyltransferase